jgi:hypothetical protein
MAAPLLVMAHDCARRTAWLPDLGLGQYEAIFRENAINEKVQAARVRAVRHQAHRRQHRQAAKHSCALSINVKHKVYLHLPHSVRCLNIMRFGEA